MRTKTRLRFQIAAVTICALVIALIAVFVWRTKSAADVELRTAQRKIERADEVAFTKIARPKFTADTIQIIQNTNDVRAVTSFDRQTFAATSGGLAQFDESGRLVKRFTVLDGLPTSDLNALAVFHGKLWIGTNAGDLLAFDNENFELYRWTDKRAAAVIALSADENKLLVGTRAAGLLEFDGRVFRELKPKNETNFRHVTLLRRDEARLFVGTFDNGLWLQTADKWQHLTTENGLPSNRVVGVAALDQNLFVATDFGLAQTAVSNLDATDLETPGKIFRPIKILPALSDLIRFDNQILALKDDGRIFKVNKVNADFQLETWNSELETGFQNARLSKVDESLRLIGNRGIWRVSEDKRLSETASDENGLTDNFISALAIGRNGDLWAGTFRRGIDILTNDGRRRRHFENDAVREINYLQPDDAQMWAATAAGAIRFDRDLQTSNITKNNGLLSDSIANLTVDEVGKSFVYATSKGLSTGESNQMRGLTTVQNLPANTVCATARIGESLFVGTLGGLAEIRQNLVVRVWKDSNSKLTTNWVSALRAVGSRLFIGTYGGAVFELLPSGELRDFSLETGKFTVNPNAMFADDQRLYIGTLDGARTFDLTSEKWTRISDVLPAQTVTSITGDANSIYFGTTNGIARVGKNFFK